MKKNIFLSVFVGAFLIAGAQGTRPEEAIKLDRKLADSLYKLARRAFMNSKKDSALIYLKSGRYYADRSGIDTLRYKFVLEEANWVGFVGNKANSLKILHTISSNALKTFTVNMWERYYNLMGSSYSDIGNYDSAIYYFRLLEKHNELNDPYRNWITFFHIGHCFDLAGIHEEGEKYLMKAYQITKGRMIRSDHGVVLNELAGILAKQRKVDQFSTILAEYKNLLKSSRIEVSKDPVHSLMINKNENSSVEESVEFLKNVKKKLLQNGDTLTAALANSTIAGVYEEDGKPREALVYILENLGPFLQKNYTEYKFVYSSSAYRLMKSAGLYKEASAMADTILRLKDKLTAENSHRTILELETKYQTDKKEKEIALLNIENNLKEAELNGANEIKMRLEIENRLKNNAYLQEKTKGELLLNQNKLKDLQIQKELELKTILNKQNDLVFQQSKTKEEQLIKEKTLRRMLISLSSLLLLAMITILLLYRKQSVKNRLIQKQSEELEVLMKEIHHRVKNNMQIVSSLLDLQSNSIKDNQAAEAVKEGKNRVQSMAIIHQHLYQDGNVRAIKMNEYIHTLTDNLFASYNVDPKKITLSTEIENINLDIDTVIPIGLIINELVSNSLKYAFKGQSAGTLNITLKDKSDHLELLVKDNGNGFPVGLNANRQHSFGLQLISAFAQKLKAKLDIYNDNGAAVFMQIKKYKIAS